MSRRIALVAVVGLSLGLLSLAACAPGASPSGTPGPSPGPSGGLAGRTFLSTSVTRNGQPFALVPGTSIRLAFGDADLSASAGCNTIGGQYRLQDGHLVFTGGAMTEMACPGGRDAQDAWLIGILSARPAITLAGNDLTLATSDTTIALVDREVAQPDQPLAGPSWIVVGLEFGDVASSVPAGVFATLTFDASGELQVATGCNTGSGRWTASDGSLRITGLTLTKKACGPPADQVETAIVGLLRSASVAYAIDGSSMTLRAGGAGLQLQAPGPD